jgi:hypothetical protein
VDYSGFHDERNGAFGRIPIAVVADCAGTPGRDPLQMLQWTATHELIEAATDPYWSSAPAFRFDPTKPEPWIIVGAELADLCGARTAVIDGVTAQRVWSNAAAAASRDPCVPAPAASVYFNVSPSPSTVQYVTAGATLQYVLTGWSNAPMDDWTIRAGPTPGSIAVVTTLNPSVINNGVTSRLMVRIPDDAPHGAIANVEIVSTSRDGQQQVWPLEIQLP